MEDQKQVCIIIPIYKSIPSKAELKSYEQARIIFKDFTIFIITHRAIGLEAYHKNFDLSYVEYFDQRYFKSVKGYNRLCLNPSFYNRFRDYKYMLIYQLDAYVFRDELLAWCTKNYDYIGAPWIDTTIKKPEAFYDFSTWFYNRIGNGGFSLRRIVFFKKWAYFLYTISIFFNKNEDFFWGVLLPKLGVKVAVPSVQEALHFAIESNPSEAFRRIGNHLPFGCHAYEKNEPEFWANFIQLN